MTLTTLNVFGDRRYARCMISFVVHIDHDGNVVFSPIYMLGLSPDPLDICGDIYACRNQDGENFPWKGRIEEVSRALASVPVTNVCFDTCLGRFSGRLAFRLDMSRGRTQLVAEAQSIGTSGLLVSGEWKLEPKRHNRTLDITAATP